MKTVCRTTALALAVSAALAASAAPAQAKSWKVEEGGSIQAAIDGAAAGDKIIVYPGTYIETHMNPSLAAVTVNKSLKLIAKSKKAPVIIAPGPGQDHGILVEGTEMAHIDGVQIKGFTVQGFDKNGIWLRYVDNFKIDSNNSVDNDENGIWPTLSANGLVKKNVSYGSEDSALWVEASENVRVLKNELYESVTGMEVTISSNVEIKLNDIHDNTVGVGLYHPNGAGMDTPDGLVPGGWVVTKNHIYDNNFPNGAPGGLAASIPPGGGVLVLGVDEVVVDKNLIENNDFYGISIIDYCLAVEFGSNPCNVEPPLVEGVPELNVFSNNELVNNGTAPDGMHPLAAYAADVTYLAGDDFEPAGMKKPIYGANVVCGTTPVTFTSDGLGSPIYQSKC